MATEKRYLFLVDDEPIQNEMLKDYLQERFAYEIKTFDNGEDMLQKMDLNPEVIILDYHLSAHNANAKNGVEILKLVKDKHPETNVVMFSGQDKIEVATDSMKYGAFDYVVKGETAFSRAENILNNIGEMQKIKLINTGYKRTITVMGLVITVILLVSLYLYFNTTAFTH